MAAAGVDRELEVAATSGHTGDQEFAAPMTGFRVRVTFALATHESVDGEQRRRHATPRGRGRSGIGHDP